MAYYDAEDWGRIGPDEGPDEVDAPVLEVAPPCEPRLLQIRPASMADWILPDVPGLGWDQWWPGEVRHGDEPF